MLVYVPVCVCVQLDSTSSVLNFPHTQTHTMIQVVFLETVAGVPGMAAGMIRHLHSLRRMERDHGWIHTLLEEAENERKFLFLVFSEAHILWEGRAGPFLPVFVDRHLNLH